jgi:galactosamine-6-phosphate isomerase
MIQVEVYADHEAMSRAAADRLAAGLRARPDSLLCLATGASPTRAYELLAEQRHTEHGLFDQARAIKLDEWGGLAADDPASCEQYLRRALIDVVGLKDRYASFAPNPADPASECRRVAEWLERSGPIDTCVLGLGLNGHLGFNEPAPFLQPHSHVAQLSGISLRHSMLDRAGRRPTYGMTLGMAELLHSRRIVLLVSGPAKVLPLHRVLRGPISTGFPASFLQLHPAVSILCDAAACPCSPGQGG